MFLFLCLMVLPLRTLGRMLHRTTRDISSLEIQRATKKTTTTTTAVTPNQSVRGGHSCATNNTRSARRRCPSPALQSATDFSPLTPLQRAPLSLAPSRSNARAPRAGEPSGGGIAKLRLPPPQRSRRRDDQWENGSAPRGRLRAL